MNLKNLQQFLIDSNTAGYAAGNEKQWIKESNGSTTIPYQKNDWKSHDNFFGSEPYGGRLVIFFQDRPVWLMVYYGWVEKSADTDAVYPVLREALKKCQKPHLFADRKSSYMARMNTIIHGSGILSDIQAPRRFTWAKHRYIRQAIWED